MDHIETDLSRREKEAIQWQYSSDIKPHTYHLNTITVSNTNNLVSKCVYIQCMSWNHCIHILYFVPYSKANLVCPSELLGSFLYTNLLFLTGLSLNDPTLTLGDE